MDNHQWLTLVRAPDPRNSFFGERGNVGLACDRGGLVRLCVSNRPTFLIPIEHERIDTPRPDDPALSARLMDRALSNQVEALASYIIGFIFTLWLLAPILRGQQAKL
jgi:hypothetical protein